VLRIMYLTPTRSGIVHFLRFRKVSLHQVWFTTRTRIAGAEKK